MQKNIGEPLKEVFYILM